MRNDIITVHCVAFNKFYFSLIKKFLQERAAVCQQKADASVQIIKSEQKVRGAYMAVYAAGIVIATQVRC
jgi:hypothetical protein